MTSKTHDCSKCWYCLDLGYCKACSVHNIHDCSKNCYDCGWYKYCDECSVTHDCSKCTFCQENKYCWRCFRYHKRIHVPLSSGSKEVDSLINEIFEWIPFERFTNVEYLAKGGFGSIYKATWLLIRWNHGENKWKREGETDVVLKSLHNSKQITSEFINEVK